MFRNKLILLVALSFTQQALSNDKWMAYDQGFINLSKVKRIQRSFYKQNTDKAWPYHGKGCLNGVLLSSTGPKEDQLKQSTEHLYIISLIADDITITTGLFCSYDKALEHFRNVNERLTMHLNFDSSPNLINFQSE